MKGPTSFVLTGSYTLDDAHVTETGFKIGSNDQGAGDVLSLNNLTPNTNTKYSYIYYVKTAEGTIERDTVTFTLPAWEFTTLRAKATSNTCAVICAETNIADEETNMGFEWRRFDAPDLVPSEDAPCAVYGGVMEGKLQGLSSGTYYKYRPYYEDAAGTRYYGDWIAFGTADAYVYFTPTVHTYATASVESNSAVLSGYALGGSDDVLEQGFEYWSVPASAVRQLADVPASGVQTVQATGQRMRASIDGLSYNTTYKYRAYVKTAKETTYGEEQSFTIPFPTGIAEAPQAGMASGELGVSVRGNLGRGDVQVKVDGVSGSGRYMLYSLNGQQLATGTVEMDGTWQPVETGCLPQGVYLLRLQGGQSTKTLKLLAR